MTEQPQDILSRLERLTFDGTEFTDVFEAALQTLRDARRDATRYRWLRTAGAWESECGMDELSEQPEKFDAAVDARMAE
jgi:hypothetical protein